jgi:tripartite-type tricarboxylate transporter receptor subunit TctC
MMYRIVGAAALLSLAASLPSAAQDAVAQFYRGKQIEIIAGSSAGGGYDTYARLIARHMGKHIPGNPSFVVQNMPGAGGNKATGYVYSVAPQDGTVIGAVFPGAILEPLLGDKTKVQHDPSKLGYVGSANEDDYLCVGRASSPVKSYKDVMSRQTIVAASGEGGTTRDLPVLERNILGAQFKVIAGYPGTREMFLAIDNGEVDGLCGLGWSAIMAQRPQAVRDHSITLLAQESIKGLAEVTAMGVPLTTSFAKNEEDKQLLELVYSQAVFGRPYIVGPGVPKDRLAALQKAFVAALQDPDLKAEAARAKLDLDYVDGPDCQALVAKLFATPPRILERAKQALVYRP